MRIDQLSETQKLRLEYLISRKAMIEKNTREILDKLQKQGKEADDIEEELMGFVFAHT
jgi:uncharacterized membrane protein (DUF106 family)